MTATDVGKGWLGVKTPKPEIAATVTRGAVRCSAWLGVAAIVGDGSERRFLTGTVPDVKNLDATGRLTHVVEDAVRAENNLTQGAA